jgi:hypothetical protein
MDVPTSEIGYTLATTGRGDHKVHKGHVVALENNNTYKMYNIFIYYLQLKYYIKYNRE